MNHICCVHAEFQFVRSVFVNVSPQIIRVNIRTNNLRAFCKLMHLGANLAGAEGNAKTDQKVTFGIGDHVGVAVAVSAADTAEVQRIVPG